MYNVSRSRIPTKPSLLELAFRQLGYQISKSKSTKQKKRLLKMGGLGVGLTSKLTQNQNKTSPHKFFSPCGSEPSTKLNQCDGQLYTILSRLFYENN